MYDEYGFEPSSFFALYYSLNLSICTSVNMCELLYHYVSAVSMNCKFVWFETSSFFSFLRLSSTLSIWTVCVHALTYLYLHLYSFLLHGQNVSESLRIYYAVYSFVSQMIWWFYLSTRFILCMFFWHIVSSFLVLQTCALRKIYVIAWKHRF